MTGLFWMLLPIAAFSGWCVAKRLPKENKLSYRPNVPDAEYYMGLSFVLQNETDKAVDHLIKMLEVNSETVELHLALALLFRKRGEVDRSIRIHQNILTRSDLSQKLNDQVLFELGLDYYTVGFLDRAEQAFSGLTNTDVYNVKAFKFLTKVHEKEKNWLAAISSVQNYAELSNIACCSQISHYYCELAIEFSKNSRFPDAFNALKKSENIDARNVRVNIVKANLLIMQNKYEDAISQLLYVANKNERYICEIIDPLILCYDMVRENQGTIGSTNEFMARYGSSSSNNNSSSNLVQLTNIDSNSAALAFIEDNVNTKASIPILRKYVDLLRAQVRHPEVKNSFVNISRLLDNFSGKTGSYLCGSCGFSGNQLFWQCPSCEDWDSLKPI